MSSTFSVQVGPRGFRIRSAWRQPIDDLGTLYRDYPPPINGIAEHSVRLEPISLVRRWIRPSIAIEGGYTLSEAAPLPLSLGLIAAEMAMNLQVALGERQFLLLHAASVERDGRAIIMTGESGSGKSTLSALLMTQGWRLLGDEFALVDTATGTLHPFPRPISLKNDAIAVMEARVDQQRFGPVLHDTPKGTLRHLLPDRNSIKAMDIPAHPALILFPAFGHARDVRPVGKSEAFMRLTQASTNYVALGEKGFAALGRLVTSVPALAIDYPDTISALDLVEQMWAELP